MKKLHALAVALLGALGGFILASIYCWWKVWVTFFYGRGAGHWYSAAVKNAREDWFTNSFWLWVAILTLILNVIAIVILWGQNRDEKIDVTDGAVTLGWIMAVVTVIGLVWSIISGFAGVKEKASYYNSNTYFAVEDFDAIPESLFKLSEGATAVSDYSTPFGVEDALIGKHDIPGRIIEESLPEAGWLARSDTFANAQRQMQFTAGGRPGTDTIKETVSYFPGTTSGEGMWTGIRDGKGKSNRIDGIVRWDGVSDVSVMACKFEGEYLLNRAIRGIKGNSLNHKLFEAMPAGWWYNMEDIYGYCSDAGEPILVFPMLKYVRSNGVAVAAPADVVLVHGSPSGEPRFERFGKIPTNSTIPGAVYPISLARSQRGEANWAAGRKWYDDEAFGYEPSDAASQSGNNADYLLRSATDGKLYWVTPLTPLKGGKYSVAFSIVPADHFEFGELNDLVVYVLPSGDKRVTDLHRLDSTITQALNGLDPAFLIKGSLQEFLPTTAGNWRTFGVDAAGFTQYVIEIQDGVENASITIKDGDGNKTLRVIQLGSAAFDPSKAACVEDLSSLSDEALLACMEQINAELGSRLNEN